MILLLGLIVFLIPPYPLTRACMRRAALQWSDPDSQAAARAMKSAGYRCLFLTVLAAIGFWVYLATFGGRGDPYGAVGVILLAAASLPAIALIQVALAIR